MSTLQVTEFHTIDIEKDVFRTASIIGVKGNYFVNFCNTTIVGELKSVIDAIQYTDFTNVVQDVESWITQAKLPKTDLLL